MMGSVLRHFFISEIFISFRKYDAIKKVTAITSVHGFITREGSFFATFVLHLVIGLLKAFINIKHAYWVQNLLV